jgi:hypothetical protein
MPLAVHSGALLFQKAISEFPRLGVKMLHTFPLVVLDVVSIASKQEKVIRSIVRLVAILMMDAFLRCEASAEPPFHRLPVPMNLPPCAVLRRFIDVPTTFPNHHTRADAWPAPLLTKSATALSRDRV